MSSSVANTGLFEFEATRIGELDAATTAADLNAITGDTGHGPAIARLLAPFNAILPMGLNPDTLFMHRAENYSDAWLVFYNKDTKNGIWICHGDEIKGVWSLTDGEYSWLQTEQVDIVASVDADGKLSLSSLK